MKIVKAKYAGFCFGVRLAVETIYRTIGEIDENTTIYTLGKLIHNSTITDDLSKKGVHVIEPEMIDNIYTNCDSNDNNKCIIFVRAHGIAKEITGKLEKYAGMNNNFKVIDCTCRDVKKIHNIVAEHSRDSDDTVTVIIGDANHPEVVGIKSYAKGDTLICASSDELAEHSDYLARNHVFMIAQTTQKLTEWKKCQKIIQKLCTNPLIFDTICRVTENRQNEVDNMSKTVDMMLIIGDRNSSNTTKLFDISRNNLETTYFIEGIHDLPHDKVTKHIASPSFGVGIAAGASTPSGIIEEVIKTMSEKVNNSVFSDSNESFADMLENSLKTLNTGETVKGIITSISPNEIHVDLGTKVTGIIPLSELSDDVAANIEEFYKVGDEVEAIVVKVSDLDGVATLSRKRIDNILNWRMIIESNANGTILDGKVVEVVKSGVIVAIKGIRVFVPASQSGVPKDGDLNTLMGTEQRVRIIEINEQRRRAVASIRVVAREERKIREESFWADIEKDKKYDGVVKSMTSYGAFVDLGGVDGMVHSSELSWRRIKHPSEVVSIGDKITVFVKDFDKEARRISLGYKTEESDPWNIFTTKYSIGDTASVKIVSMTPFGAFAEVVPGTDGLIHISQIADRKINQPSDVLELGQVVDAKVIDIDTERKKISLSVRALIEDAKDAEAAEASELLEQINEENSIEETPSDEE
jgi:(E)-4-hydroxy-3-methyl-but-2-enyl pyrophosphate reductase (IPP and DMAPP forming)